MLPDRRVESVPVHTIVHPACRPASEAPLHEAETRVDANAGGTERLVQALEADTSRGS